MDPVFSFGCASVNLLSRQGLYMRDVVDQAAVCLSVLRTTAGAPGAQRQGSGEASSPG